MPHELSDQASGRSSGFADHGRVERDVDVWMRPRVADFLAELRRVGRVDSGSANAAGVDLVGDLVAGRLSLVRVHR